MAERGEKQISLTDADARSMMLGGNRGTQVGYNVQISVDAKHNLIVDHEVTNERNDMKLLSSMAIRAKEALEVESLEEAQSLVSPSASLRVWLAAALCWAHAHSGDLDAAIKVRRDLAPAARAETVEFLQDMVAAVLEGEALLPYADLFVLFASAQLRSTTASSGGGS